MKIRQTIIASIFFLAFFFSTNPGQGQAHFGIKSGIITADVRMSGHKSDIDLPEDWFVHNPRIAPHLGFFAIIPLNDKVYLQTEVQYLEKGFTTDFDDVNNVERKSINRFQSFGLPLLVGIQINRLSVSIGPEIEYLFRTTNKVEGFDVMDNIVIEDQKWLFGFNLGLSHQLQERLQLGLRANFGLTPLSEVIFTNDNGEPLVNASMYNVSLQAFVGYHLFGAE